MVASVTIGEETKDSGIDGVVEFTRAYGDYEATISAEGYATVTEELAFRSNHKNFEIELESSHTGTVTVLGIQGEDDIPIENATVSIYEDTPQGELITTATTDTNGVANFNLPYGAYDIRVTATNWVQTDPASWGFSPDALEYSVWLHSN